MSAARFIRQSHRWLSIAFTLTVLANFAAIGMGADDCLAVLPAAAAIVPVAVQRALPLRPAPFRQTRRRIAGMSAMVTFVSFQCLSNFPILCAMPATVPARPIEDQHA